MVLLILIREIKILIKDRTAVMILLVMPIVLLTILGFALRDTFESYDWTDPIHIAIVKQYEKMGADQIIKTGAPNEMVYQGIIASLGEGIEDIDVDHWFFQEFLADEQVSQMLNWSIMDSDSANQALDSGAITAVVVLPESFERNIVTALFFDNAEPVEVRVEGYNTSSFSYKVVRALMDSFASTINDNYTKQKIRSYLMTGQPSEGMNPDAFSQSIESTDIKLSIESLYKRPALSSFQYYSAAILAMFLFYGAGFVGTRILDEMKGNTFQRQLTARIKPVHILTANALLGSIISILQMVIIMVFSRLAFGVLWGNLWVTALGVIGAAAAMGGINLFLAVLTVKANNYQIINGFRNILIHVFALLGGSYLPIDMLPSIFQKLSFFTLNGLTIKIWTKGMQLYTVQEAVPLLLGLLAFAAGFSIIGLLLYPWKEGVTRV